MRNKLISGWAKAIWQNATEFDLTPLSVVAGEIPQGLRGSLYYNGPARFERQGQRIGHWFDGDGAVLAVNFTNTGATGIYRYVQTAAYQAEEKAGKFLYESYGIKPIAPIWQQLVSRPKNCANVSVLALDNRLLALWSGGLPYALDLVTLETFGEDDLAGLEKNAAYSPNPKRDPQTQDIYNFGVTFTTKAILHIYRSDRTGKIQQKAEVTLDSLPLIHDFVLAGDYLVFCIPPVRLNPVPYLARLKSFSDSLQWLPELGTEILVIDKSTLKVISRRKSIPWFQWQFVNGYMDNSGALVVQLIRYQDFQINQFFQEVVTGKTQTTAKGGLWQIRIDPQSAEVIEMVELLNRSCNFSTIPADRLGQFSPFIYFLMHRQGVNISKELYGAIACFNCETGHLVEADLGENYYPVQPIYAPDVENSEQGWLLTTVFNSSANSSEICIFDAKHLQPEPICRLALPHIIPLAFAGVWHPR
jgi:carotenoid cleavage dioxygenase-like enzyme